MIKNKIMEMWEGEGGDNVYINYKSRLIHAHTLSRLTDKGRHTRTNFAVVFGNCDSGANKYFLQCAGELRTL